MIVTVTLNTDFADVCLTDVSVTSKKWADIIARERVASGKGVNAARIIAALGAEVIATGFVGLDAEEEFSKFVASYNVEPAFVSVGEPTRSSIYVLPRVGPPTGFRAPGFSNISTRERQGLFDRVGELVKPGDWLLLAGSAPNDDAMMWSDIGSGAREAGATVVWDAYGNNMLKALQKLQPEVIKLNQKEVEMTFDRQMQDVEAVAALSELASDIAIVTVGEEGSFMSHKGLLYKAVCPNEHRQIEIGAGDSFAGGLLFALSEKKLEADEALRFAEAVGSAYVDGSSLSTFSQSVDEYLARTDLSPVTV